MDIMMPEMDGYETTRAIRADAAVHDAADHRADGQGDEGRPREVHRAGASDYITKPVDTEQLLSLMRVWLYQLSRDRAARRPPRRGRLGARALEIELLLEAIFRHYGFDFRSYAYASLQPAALEARRSRRR